MNENNGSSFTKYYNGNCDCSVSVMFCEVCLPILLFKYLTELQNLS